jgi:hypothetical protein
MKSPSEPAETAPRDLKQAIYQFMPLIDPILAAAETPLGMRALHAATRFVEDLVVDVSTETDKENFKENFALKPWFAIIYHHVDNWYRETYAEALKRGHEKTACGVVLVRDLPVELDVPLTTSRIETPGETAWLTFPVTVEEDEEPLSWLKGAPNIVHLSEQDQTRVLNDAVEVATALRSIRINFMGVEPRDDTVSGLLEGVLPEFESAARQILRRETSGRASALWTLQMALERVLKAYAQHRMGTFRQIHNLFELFDDAARHGFNGDRELLKKLPRDREVMSDRYGLRGTPTLQEMIEAYNAALTLVSVASGQFNRKFNVGGASFLLRKAPWITLPSEKSPS